VEHDNFARLVRLIGAARTRREALRLAAAGALVGGIATREGAEAKHRRRRGRVSAQQTAVVPCPGPPTLRDCSNKKIAPGANLSNCDFIRPETGIPNVNLRSANVSGSSFSGTDLFGPASFRGANASNVCFGGSGLDFADFRGANVSNSNFCGADLRGANFLGSNITQEQLDCAMVGCDTIKPNGKPAVECTGGQICCTAVCCDPDSCIDNTCEEPPAP
jgi:hypothetical protein